MKSIQKCVLEYFVRTLKVAPTDPKPSLPQNSLKSKEINSTKSTIKKSYA